MRKWSKFLVIFIVGVIGLTLLITLNPTKPSEVPPQLNTCPTSTTLSSSSSIFSEITTDGLASYLEIQIPETAINVSGIKITQTVGTVPTILAKDEKGTTCYYENASGISKETTFYFTRPATYTVQYVVGENVKTERCTFSPEINFLVVNTLFTTKDGGQTKSNITSANNKFFFTTAGALTIPQDSHGLYTLSASIPACMSNIPENAFGTVTYKLTSNSGHTELTQDVTIITTAFDINFASKSTPLNKNNYLFNNGYVFNSGLEFSIEINGDATNITTNSALTTNDKLYIFNTLNFQLKCDERNATNTAVSSTKIIDLVEPTISPVLVYELNTTDHTIYTIITNIKNSNTALDAFTNNIPQFKILTKVPVNEQNNYIFSIVLGQIEKSATNNYLAGVLNGYIPQDTTIYFPFSAIRIFYNGYENLSNELVYKSTSGAQGTINKGMAYADLTASNENRSTITLCNQTLSFDESYMFTFNIKSYKPSGSDDTKDFKAMLKNRMYYNGSTLLNDNLGDHKNEIKFPINSFKYIVPNNYSQDFIPMYIRVTYNGTVFDNIYNLTDSDIVEFSESGKYTIEFYNVPNYEFIKQNYVADDKDASIWYYYNLQFTIAGPSIYASTLDRSGKTITLSNNMYTQNAVDINVGMNENQQMIVYKNGEEYARRDASMDFTLSDIGTWKVNIIDAENNVLKSLTFTIADTVYQGFSINNQEEYAKLVVGTQISNMPVIYSPMEESNAYHLTYAGTYKIDIDAKEILPFTVDGAKTSAHTINSNSIVLSVQKSYFSLFFANGKAGSRTSTKVIVSSVGGVQLQSLEVYRNNKLIKTFTAEELADFDTIVENNRSFSDNGIYTFKLTDKFGNTYEAQMEKYYKVNVALIFLILLAIVGVIMLIVFIIKSRHKIKVK